MYDLLCTFVIFPKGGKVNIAGIRRADDLDAIAERLKMFERYRKVDPEDETDKEEEEESEEEEEIVDALMDEEDDDHSP